MTDKTNDRTNERRPEPWFLYRPPEVVIDHLQEFLGVATRGIQRSSFRKPAQDEQALNVLRAVEATVGASLRKYGTQAAGSFDPTHPTKGSSATTSTPLDGSDPTGKRCLASFRPQAWVKDQAVDVDGARHFDITELVLKLGRDEALAIRDNRDESDALAAEAGLLVSHGGPYRVECEEAIREFFGLDNDGQEKPPNPQLSAAVNMDSASVPDITCGPSSETLSRRFYKATYRVTVLSADEPFRDDDLYNFAYAIDEGDCVGDVVESCVEVSREEMARLLVEVGSDPSFFGSDDGDDR